MKCDLHPDTIRHRWVCPGRADAREGIKQETIDYALRDGNELLAERGLVHHPASIQPLPKSGLHYLTFGYYGEGKKEEDIVFSGEVAMGGSCFPHPCKDLWRAGWSVLEFDERGDILRGIMGNVPAELPQTSVSGEYCAAAAFLEKSRAGAVGHSDCANVVKDWEAGDRRANLRPDKATAGFWKHCCAFGSRHTRTNIRQRGPGQSSSLEPMPRQTLMPKKQHVIFTQFSEKTTPLPRPQRLQSP